MISSHQIRKQVHAVEHLSIAARKIFSCLLKKTIGPQDL